MSRKSIRVAVQGRWIGIMSECGVWLDAQQLSGLGEGRQ